MKNLTRILLLVTFATIKFQSFAQIYGIKAGLNISNCALIIYDEYQPNTKIKFGINLGGTVEFDIGDSYSLETGLTFNNKGLKILIPDGTDTITQLGYLEIPINLVYTFNLKRNRLYLSAGPYFGFGITGTILWKGYNGDYHGESVHWGKNGADNELKRLDYGINLGAKYEFGVFGAGVQYGLGLANIRPPESEIDSQKNRLLSIYLAFKFGKK